MPHQTLLLTDIINSINTRNGATFVINSDDADLLQKFIYQFEQQHYIDLTYLDHGGSCICFHYSEHKSDKQVLKIYFKKNNKVLQSKHIFEDYMNHLLKIGLPIAKTDIIFESNNHLIAIQPYFMQIDDEKINALTAKNILRCVETMLDNRTRLHDVYYKNFGISRMQLYIFDFHESINFYDNIDLFVSNLLQLFSQLFTGKHAFGEINPDINKIKESGYNATQIPHQYSAFLRAIHEYHITEALRILREEIYPDLGERIACKFVNYQHYEISKNGEMTLQTHTKQKAEIALANIGKSATILDAGCSYGAIGIYLKQRYPDSEITLNNMDENELKECKRLAQSIGIFDMKYRNQSVMTLSSEKYDLTLFFALVHHILRTQTMEEFMQFVKSITRRIAIIEFPIKGDILLEQVIANNVNFPETYLWNDRYQSMTSLDILRKKVSEYGQIMDVRKMDYDGMNGINRITIIIDFLCV